MRARRTLARTAVGIAAALVVLAGTGVSGAGAGLPAPSTEIRKFRSDLGSAAGDSEPQVVPVVECVVHRGRRDTFWFGYESSPLAGQPTVQADVTGDRNTFVELDAAGDGVAGAPNRGQVDQFFPGRHRRTFSVTVERGHSLQWTVSSPALSPTHAMAPGDRWDVQLTTARPHACQDDDARSATVQAVGRSAGIDILPVDVRNPGVLPVAAVDLTVIGVRSACDVGGEPLAPVVLWGYDDTVVLTTHGGVQAVVPRGGFAPVGRRDVVRTDVFGTGVAYVRTWSGHRDVVDPATTWLSTLTGTPVRGLAMTSVLADVYGRCRYGNRIVTSSESAWAASDGFPTPVVVATDDATGRTVPCLGDVACPVPRVEGPGGGRWR